MQFRQTTLAGQAALCLLALGLAVAAQAAAPTVLTFDDLSGQGHLAPSYAGLTWSGWQYYDRSQALYTPASGAERLYSYETDGTFTFAQPVVFDGAWFTGSSHDQLTFTLFDGQGSPVATSATLLPSGTPTFLGSGYTGLVQTVSLHQTAPDLAVMDSLTFHVPGPAPAAIPAAVPEPSTGSVLSFGVLGLLALGLRTRQGRQTRP